METQTLSLTRSPLVPVAIGFSGLGAGYFFVGCTLIYLVEIPTRFLSWNTGGRLVGLLQLVVGIWLMYCTYTTAIHLALGSGA